MTLQSPKHALLTTLIPFLIGVPLCFGASEPSDQLDHLNRAVVLFNSEKWPEAAKAWEQITVVNPMSGRAWNNFARASHRCKDYRKAIRAYAKMLDLRSGYPFTAAYGTACCYAQLGEKEAALEWLQKALALGFRSLRVIRDDSDLRSLHDDPRFREMIAMVDRATLSRDEGWRFDLDLLVREIKRCHYSPFRKVRPEQFDTTYTKLRNEIHHLSDNQIAVGFQKILCLVGDGHTSLSSQESRQAKQRLIPAHFYFFAEGLYITEVDTRFRDLAGVRVTRIGGHTIDEVLESLDQVIAHDNSQGVLWHAPECLRDLRTLNGLGLIPDDKSLPLTIEDPRGKERTVSLPAGSGASEADWISARPSDKPSQPLYLKNTSTAYWFEPLAAEKTVYFQWNAVMDQGSETFEAFCKRLFQYIDGHDVERLVIDLRLNGGGNNFLNAPLVQGLIRCDKINHSDKLFVIAGRNTFSAAMCAAANIERDTSATFVGEPTGSSPNFVGESAVIVELPYSKLTASISDLYWQNTVAMDYRTWIPPSIYAPPTFDAYRANRDPALEAILARLRAETPKKSNHTTASGEKKNQTTTSKEADASSYTITTFAGDGTRGFAGDLGPAVKASLNMPCAVALDREGRLYVADYGNNRIRKIEKDGVISTCAGTGVAGDLGDGGPATEAQLSGPYGVAVDKAGNIYIADQRNNRIRKIAHGGRITTVAGTGRRELAGDGGPANEASLAGPDAVLIDDQGNVLIADSGNHRIRKIATDGTITTIAGTTRGYSGDGGPAARAQLNLPASVALDRRGNLYVGDLRNHVVRKISSQGVISTVAGTGTAGFNGDDRPAATAQLNQPGGVGLLTDGSLIIADGANFRVRRVGSDGRISTIAGTGKRAYGGDGGSALQADLAILDILATDSQGNVYLADFGNNRVRKLALTGKSPRVVAGKEI
jgi:tetratricopeptide (TPR) repeat protein/sugar lactone lactonase YvrE